MSFFNFIIQNLYSNPGEKIESVSFLVTTFTINNTIFITYTRSYNKTFNNTNKLLYNNEIKANE